MRPQEDTDAINMQQSSGRAAGSKQSQPKRWDHIVKGLVPRVVVMEVHGFLRGKVGGSPDGQQGHRAGDCPSPSESTFCHSVHQM